MPNDSLVTKNKGSEAIKSGKIHPQIFVFHRILVQWLNFTSYRITKSFCSLAFKFM